MRIGYNFCRTGKHLVFLASIHLIILTYPGFVLSSVPESDLIPFTVSAGNNRFEFGDDRALPVQFLESPFKFLNVTYWGVNISSNGLVSFGQEYKSAGPPTNCGSTGIPLAIPFWADANQAMDPVGSSITYMETANAAYLIKIGHVLREAFPHSQAIEWAFVVTWRKLVAHESSPAVYASIAFPRNTFQLILATDNQRSFVLFYYNQLRWTKGASTAAGFDYGPSFRNYKLPGSCSNNILNIEQNSNFNVTGKWAFQVDNDIVVPGSVKPSKTETCKKGKAKIRVDPLVVPITGNMPIVVHELCLEEDANISCVFEDNGQQRPTESEGIILQKAVICPVPFLYSLGKIRLNIRVSYPERDTVTHAQSLLIVKEHEYSDLPIIHLNKTEHATFISAQWDPALLSMNHIKTADSGDSNNDATVPNCARITIILLEHDGKKWRKLGPLTPPILNNGIHMSPLNTTLLDALLQKKGKILLRTFALEATHTLKSGESVQKLLPANVVLGTNSLKDWTNDYDDERTFFANACQTWADNNQPDLPSDTLPCPYTVAQARLDWRFGLETAPHWLLLNEGASSVYMQLVPSLLGAASHCAYDNDGRLMSLVPSIGRVFRRSPNSVTGYWRHFLEDVLPFMYCCKWGITNASAENDTFQLDKCPQYFRKRPINLPQERNYEPPQPFRAVGASHLTSFDRNTYRFNGAGEYWMIKFNGEANGNYNHVIDKFEMQARMEPVASFNVSTITAVVMEESRNEYDVKVQLEVDPSAGMSVLVDGEPLKADSNKEFLPNNDSPWNFQNQLVLYHTGVIVVLKSTEEATISFGSGFAFNFKYVHDNGNNATVLNIVGSAGPNAKGKVNGLLGNYDGVAGNDFQLPNGTNYTILNDNMTIAEIHKSFGKQWLVSQSESIFSYLSGNKSYISYYQPDFYPALLISSQEHLTSLPEVEICNNLQDCNLDYNATASEVLARGTVGATNLYQEIKEMSETVVGQCDSNPSLRAGVIKGTSRVVGSTLQLKCDGVFHNLTCAYASNMTTNQLPNWVNSTGHVVNNFHCDIYRKSEPTSSTSYWAMFLVCICVLVVSTIVLIARYPPCKLVRDLIVVKYQSYRTQPPRNNENISFSNQLFQDNTA